MQKVTQPINIVLYQPEIPHNTGAIGRTCLITGARLHLIHPLGFFIDEKSLKRSGLDYWPQLDVSHYVNFEDFVQKNKNITLYIAESGIGEFYTDIKYKFGDYIMFGSESTGVPAHIVEKYSRNIVKIPMKKEERSLNLSVSVGIVLYEVLRQTGFVGLV